MLIQDQFGIIHNLQISPILQTSNWSRTFFAISYSKPALVLIFCYSQRYSLYDVNLLPSKSNLPFNQIRKINYIHIVLFEAQSLTTVNFVTKTVDHIYYYQVNNCKIFLEFEYNFNLKQIHQKSLICTIACEF